MTDGKLNEQRLRAKGEIMGVSTNATLAFGFDLGEELPEAFSSEDDGFDFSEWAERKAGMEWKSEDKDFWRRRNNMLAALPVTMEMHCSGDCPMYFLALNHSVTSARRGRPEEANVFEPTQRQVNDMRSFCQTHGIEWEEPKWHVFSYWG